MNLLVSTIFLILCFSDINQCFIPNKLVDSLALRLNHELNLDEASETLTHGEITKRGLIKSIAKYLHEQKETNTVKPENVRLNRISSYWEDIRNLYSDFYSHWFNKLEIDNLIETSFRINVAMVDFDEKMKDLPQAHFDANMFVESNQRVIDYSRAIITAILRKDYVSARQLAAEVLHTIQDFYSHTNWIEMGNENAINEEIGTLRFNKKYEVRENNVFSATFKCFLMYYFF